MERNTYTYAKRMALTLVFFCMGLMAQAAFLRNVPTLLVQPNGDTLRCFQTGDEFYHRLHDTLGYTIVQNPATGYYVYAQMGASGQLEPSTIEVLNQPQESQLRAMGIRPNMMPSAEVLDARRKTWDVPVQLRKPESKTGTTNRGTINNIVVFIRFADEAASAFSTTFSTINSMFNDSSSTSTSMYKYFREVSYGQLTIQSHFYPTPSGNQVISYQDSLPRSYFQPYNATTNPNGYTNQAEREFGLIARCIRWINQNSLIPSNLNIDYDNDGYVDNIIFVVSGTYTGWSDLLWPHKWSLYDRYCYINNKRVYTFNLQLEGSGSGYFNSSVFCHEMFHALGAPDLYHYESNTEVSPAGAWDLMCSNTQPPQHTSAFMKMIYGNWIDNIPEITTSGTYTLSSLADQNPTHARAYRIASDDPNQYYVLEYRDNTEHFETALPGSGLLVWRVDTRYDGNANEAHDGYYIFRPNAANETTNGSPNQAHFGAHVSRASFTPQTNPHPWLNTNTPDPYLSLTNIQKSSDNSSLSFTYTDLRANLHTSEQELTFASNGGSQSVTVIPGMNSSIQWQAQPSTSWISVSPTSGSGSVSGTLTVTTSTNTTGDFREGYVYLSQGSEQCTLHVVQSACLPYEMCDLTVVMLDSYGDGWNGSSLTLETPSGFAYGTVSLGNGNSGTADVGVCNSQVRLRWTSGSNWDSEISFHVVNGNNDTLYRTTGTPTAGVMATLTNPCPNCEATAPWSENFNSVSASTYNTAGVLPSCWGGYTNGTNSIYSPHVVGSSSYWYSPDNSPSLCLTSGSSTYGDTKYVRLPHFTQAVNQLELSFWSRMESTTNGSTLTVGYFTSDQLENSFVPVQTITSTSGSTHTVSFANVPSSAMFIGFRWVHTSSFYSCCIDNVQVDTLAAPTTTYYTVTATSNNNAWGTVSGGGQYAQGTTATLTATPTACHHFVSWSNGSTANPLTVTVNGNLNLTATFAANSYVGSSTAQACDSYSWHGLTYTSTGTYTWQGQTAQGCDSTATLHLTIHHSTSSSLNITDCDSYIWNGYEYTSSGNYHWQGLNSQGCDSTATLQLTLHPSVSRSISDSACDSYTWHGATYTTSGDYTWQGQTIHGCDSTVTLTLVVNYSSTTELSVTDTDSYSWMGSNLTSSGDYTWHGQSIFGCDSTIILHLTLIPSEPAGIGEAGASAITLYPNPSHGTVTIEGYEGEVQVIDLLGRVVKRQLITHLSPLLTLESLPRGTYIVKTGEEIHTLILQ